MPFVESRDGLFLNIPFVIKACEIIFGDIPVQYGMQSTDFIRYPQGGGYSQRIVLSEMLRDKIRLTFTENNTGCRSQPMSHYFQKGGFPTAIMPTDGTFCIFRNGETNSLKQYLLIRMYIGEILNFQIHNNL